MATPEHSSHLAQLKEALAAVETRLEIADENENTIERTASREALLEHYDQIQDDIAAIELPE
jgi:hypothetical protein